MEYVDGGNLDVAIKKTGPIPEPVIAKVALSVTRGLEYLFRKHRIIHCDVKPSNVLINTQGRFKICDFHLATLLTSKKSFIDTFQGTRQYMSPERLKGSGYSFCGDIWSLGMMLLESALGFFPLPPPSPEEFQTLFGVPKELITLSEDQIELRRKISPPESIIALCYAIMELPPPLLPNGLLSSHFDSFSAKCLDKVAEKRGTLKDLLKEAFLTEAQNNTVDIVGWVAHLAKLPEPPTYKGFMEQRAKALNARSLPETAQNQYTATTTPSPLTPDPEQPSVIRNPDSAPKDRGPGSFDCPPTPPYMDTPQ